MGRKESRGTGRQFGSIPLAMASARGSQTAHGTLMSELAFIGSLDDIAADVRHKFSRIES